MTDTPTVEPAKADSLSIRDNRTGREYEIAITDGTIRAADLRQIDLDGGQGLATYDPGSSIPPPAAARSPSLTAISASSSTAAIPSSS